MAATNISLFERGENLGISHKLVDLALSESFFRSRLSVPVVGSGSRVIGPPPHLPPFSPPLGCLGNICQGLVSSDGDVRTDVEINVVHTLSP